MECKILLVKVFNPCIMCSNCLEEQHHPWLRGPMWGTLLAFGVIHFLSLTVSVFSAIGLVVVFLMHFKLDLLCSYYIFLKKKIKIIYNFLSGFFFRFLLGIQFRVCYFGCVMLQLLK